MTAIWVCDLHTKYHLATIMREQKDRMGIYYDRSICGQVARFRPAPAPFLDLARKEYPDSFCKNCIRLVKERAYRSVMRM